MAHSSPIYDPAQAITGSCSADIAGGLLVKVAAAKTDGNPVSIAIAGASDSAIGVVAEDAKSGDLVPVYTAGHVLSVTAGGTVTAGSAVEVMAGGKVQDLASGKKVGVAFTGGSANDSVLVQIQF